MSYCKIIRVCLLLDDSDGNASLKRGGQSGHHAAPAHGSRLYLRTPEIVGMYQKQAMLTRANLKSALPSVDLDE